MRNVWMCPQCGQISVESRTVSLISRLPVLTENPCHGWLASRIRRWSWRPSLN